MAVSAEQEQVVDGEKAVWVLNPTFCIKKGFLE